MQYVDKILDSKFVPKQYFGIHAFITFLKQKKIIEVLYKICLKA